MATSSLCTKVCELMAWNNSVATIIWDFSLLSRGQSSYAQISSAKFFFFFLKKKRKTLTSRATYLNRLTIKHLAIRLRLLIKIYYSTVSLTMKMTRDPSKQLLFNIKTSEPARHKLQETSITLPCHVNIKSSIKPTTNKHPSLSHASLL